MRVRRGSGDTDCYESDGHLVNKNEQISGWVYNSTGPLEQSEHLGSEQSNTMLPGTKYARYGSYTDLETQKDLAKKERKAMAGVVEVRQSQHGLGLFALVDLAPGELVLLLLLLLLLLLMPSYSVCSRMRMSLAFTRHSMVFMIPSIVAPQSENKHNARPLPLALKNRFGPRASASSGW